MAHPPCAPRHPEGVLVAYVDGDRPPTAGPLLALFGHPMDDQETQVYAPGTVLLEKYVIDRCVARGGMGVVYRAINLDLEAPVALKTLFVADQECEENLQQRALLEAKLAAKLRGEHIAQVLDAGWLDDRQPYIVMEYLEGRDLRGHIEEQGVLEVAEAVSIVQQACLGLAEAHDRGIVHRDLKPENLFTAEQPDGRQLVKVLDFGISKDTFRSAGPRQLTGPNTILGSPDYMSPEQLEDAAAVDHRTDIWALGCVLYEMLAGVTPFEGPTPAVTCSRALQSPMPALRDVRPDVPVELEDVLRRCLEKDRHARYADMAALSSALAPFAGTRGEHFARRTAATTSTPPPRHTSQEPDSLDGAVQMVGSTTELTRPLSWAWLAAAIAVVVVTFGAWSQRGEPNVANARAALRRHLHAKQLVVSIAPVVAESLADVALRVADRPERPDAEAHEPGASAAPTAQGSSPPGHITADGSNFYEPLDAIY